MPKYLNLIGQKFGRLTVIKRTDKKPRAWYLCKCDCGSEKVMSSMILRSGDAKSCGCLKKETDGKHCLKHGHAPSKDKLPSPTYHSWRAMKQRCLNPNHKGYHDYGARGITICERWMNFENFLHDMGIRPDGTEIERKDNSLGYFKENCVWATHSTNCRNTRGNLVIEFNGERKCLAEWAALYGLAWHTLFYRIFRLDWDISKALTEPVRPSKEPPAMG